MAGLAAGIFVAGGGASSKAPHATSHSMATTRVAGTSSIGAVSGASKDPTSLIDRRNAAWNKGDTSAVASLYAPNAVLTFLDSSTYVGRAAITAQIKESYLCKNHTKRVSPVSVARQLRRDLHVGQLVEQNGVLPVHGNVLVRVPDPSRQGGTRVVPPPRVHKSTQQRGGLSAPRVTAKPQQAPAAEQTEPDAGLQTRTPDEDVGLSPHIRLTVGDDRSCRTSTRRPTTDRSGVIPEHSRRRGTACDARMSR